MALDRASLRSRRCRWRRGLLQVLWRNRGVIGNPRFGAVGLGVLPYTVIMEGLGPLLELSGYDREGRLGHHETPQVLAENSRSDAENRTAAGASGSPSHCLLGLCFTNDWQASCLIQRRSCMPSSETILAGLTQAANRFQLVAIGWHVLLAAFVVALAARWRPAPRLVGYSLVTPLASVSAIAWMSGNPFNGVTFALMAAALAVAARTLSLENTAAEATPFLAPGALLVAFSWMYPHFLDSDRLTTYAYAAPLGLIPCPTLAMVIGLTLALGLQGSLAWGGLLSTAGVCYGVIGVFRLGVTLDYVLLAGAVMLAAASLYGSTAAPLRHLWRDT